MGNKVKSGKKQLKNVQPKVNKKRKGNQSNIAAKISGKNGNKKAKKDNKKVEAPVVEEDIEIDEEDVEFFEVCVYLNLRFGKTNSGQILM